MSEQSDHQLGEYIHYRWIPWSSHGMTESGGLTAVFRLINRALHLSVGLFVLNRMMPVLNGEGYHAIS